MRWRVKDRQSAVVSQKEVTAYLADRVRQKYPRDMAEIMLKLNIIICGTVLVGQAYMALRAGSLDVRLALPINLVVFVFLINKKLRAAT